MANSFDKIIADLQREILDLKTSHEYASVRVMYSQKFTSIETGSYKITYDCPPDAQIMSFFYHSTMPARDYRILYNPLSAATTQIGNTQIYDINTTYFKGDEPTTYQVELTISSNYPVLKIERV